MWVTAMASACFNNEYLQFNLLIQILIATERELFNKYVFINYSWTFNLYNASHM